MSNETEARRELLERIRARRSGISTFVHDLDARGTRLTNLSIVCSAIVTVLTAGPALGGTRFTDASSNVLNVSDESLIWRILCLLAMVLSIVVAVATNMYKARDVASRLAKAEATNVALEGLETLVEFEQVSTADAVQQYQQRIADIPFIPDQVSPAPVASAPRRRSRERTPSSQRS
jgi:hypothetical protein